MWLKENEALCSAGTDPNCQVFQRTANECQDCYQGYYLNIEKKCAQQPQIDLCKVRSLTALDRCSTCDNNALNYDIDSKCVAVNVIESCLLYSDPDTCSKCKQGFTIKNDVCVTYESASASNKNCLEGSTTTCSLCQNQHYIKSSTNLCEKPAGYFSNFC